MQQRNIPALVAQMTLEEKAGLCSGLDFWHTKPVSRLGIPPVMVSDGPHGLRKQDDAADTAAVNESIKAVCFPTGSAAAASFDPEMLRQMGRTLGEECRAERVSVLLGPAVNIKRSPLCGRNFEYYSEDPYLAGCMASAFVQGVQEWDVGTSIKHFACNNQEFYRMSNDSRMSERTLREIYLPAFEMAVKQAQPWTIMCSYNRLNGTYACENHHLLTEILRDDWGYQGYVMTDWGAMNRRVEALLAGCELEMPASGGVTDAVLVQAVRSGALAEEALDKAVTLILNKVFAYADVQRPEAVFDRAADHAKAVQAAKNCAVLLQNNGILPLKAGQKVAYIGGFAETPRFQGGGSSHINCWQIDSALAAANAAGRSVCYAKGFVHNKDEFDEALAAQAVQAAQQADAAVIFAGLPDIFESEGYDRTHLNLPDCQTRVIEAVLAVQPNTVVVLHNGSPVVCPWADKAAAVLEMYLAGEGVGAAADALLWGEANPSGRLAESFPLRLEDTPCYLDFARDPACTNYSEGVYVGYRWYDSRRMAVQWPFGHGLSYTTFEWSNARLSSAAMSEGETVTVSVDITNTGSMTGKEVVQLYVQDCTGTPGRPEKELKGFAKIELAPGQTGTVTLSIDKRSLAYFDEELNDWYAAAGEYKLLLAHSSRNVETALSVQYTPACPKPMRVDENTPVGLLLKDARAAAVLRQLPQAALIAMGLAEEQKSETANEAFPEEATQAMGAAYPLRAMRSFGGMTEEAVQALVRQLNRVLSEA